MDSVRRAELAAVYSQLAYQPTALCRQPPAQTTVAAAAAAAAAAGYENDDNDDEAQPVHRFVLDCRRTGSGSEPQHRKQPIVSYRLTAAIAVTTAAPSAPLAAERYTITEALTKDHVSANEQTGRLAKCVFGVGEIQQQQQQQPSIDMGKA